MSPLLLPLTLVSFSFLSLAIFIIHPRAATAAETRKQFIDHQVNLPTKRPLVIAHRGSSGTLPEHTLLAYQRAIDEGADVIECDVTLTRDLVPVCLHDNWLETTTDVAERSEFSSRKRSRTIEETSRHSWFAVDFDLRELKTLRKKQSAQYRDQSFNGKLEIATFEEYIQLARTSNRTIGLYPELKDPEWINSLDILNSSSKQFEDIVLDVLTRYNYSRRQDPCFIQSFSESSLKYLSTRTELPLVLLIMDSIPDSQLEQWSKHLYGIGAWVNVIAIHYTEQNGYKNWIERNTSDLITKAHLYGMKIHVWTLRNEDQFLAWDFHQDIRSAFDYYLALGIDGIFTDFPLTLVRHLNDLYGVPDGIQQCLQNRSGMANEVAVTTLIAAMIAAIMFVLF